MDIKHLEQLAKITLTEEERVKTVKELGTILEYMRELGDSEAEDTKERVSRGNVYREDVVVQEFEREEMLANAPKVSYPYIKVPRTI